MARLIIQGGRHHGKEFPITDGMVMGRSRNNAVPVPEIKVSREHAMIEIEAGKMLIHDMGSRNGTFVNGQRIEGQVEVKLGDKILIGSIEYLVAQDAEGARVGETIGGCKLLEKIGEGGMGEVYKARQLSMDRLVAVKIISDRLADDKKFVERFVKEARAAGKLNHPNLIQVHDVGKAGEGVYFFTMEYVEGKTAFEILRDDKQIPLERVLHVIIEAARGLQYAHNEGLLHRDIKPDNLMVSVEDEVKIADLGIAIPVEQGTEVEARGEKKVILGTPHYMAPEQILRRKLDHRVDIYALGASAYHLIAGRPPFRGKQATDILKQHLKSPLKHLEEYDPECPDELFQMIAKMMSKRPENRYQDCAEVADALQAFKKDYFFEKPPAPMKEKITSFLSPSQRELSPVMRYGMYAALTVIVLFLMYIFYKVGSSF